MKSLIKIIQVHIRYRRQILKMAKADLIKTYKGAALGWAWAVIQPTMRIFIYFFALSVGLRRGTSVNGYSSILWLLAGMAPWFYINSMFSGGAGCIRRYGYLVTKVKYPVETIPSFYSLSNLFVNVCFTLIVLVVFVITGHNPDIYWLQIPLYTLLMTIFFTTWALFAGLISVVSRDFLHLVRSMTLALFWLSGIIYDVNSIGNRKICKVMLFNPVTITVDGYRNALIYKHWFWERLPELRNFAIMYVILVVLTLWVYKRLIKTIPDVL